MLIKIILKLFVFGILINLFFYLNPPLALAENLENRLNSYPNWNHQLSLPKPEQDLVYPQWFEGKWQVTNILKEQIAPFSPQFETPGFSANAQYLDQEVIFPVQFISRSLVSQNNRFVPSKVDRTKIIIADRQFNGSAIALAYLGEKNVKNVTINQNNSTEQITKFGEDNELISTIIGRRQENISEKEFITSEMTRQFFRRVGNIYLNLVETTTKYKLVDPNYIQAEQVTAVYLSPQDPDYFIAFDKPVALYSYKLNLHKLTTKDN